MSSHHVVGDSPFLKRVLIPFWVIRIIIMVIDIAACALFVGALGVYRNNVDRMYENYGYEFNVDATIAVYAVILVVILVCLVLDIVCIIKRARRSLSPPFFLIVNIVQTIIWTILFILSLVTVRSAFTVGVSVIVYLTFVGLLIYASVIYHRYKKGTLSRAVPAYGAPVQTHVQPGGEHLIPNNNNYPQPTQVYHNGYTQDNGYNSAPVQKPAFYGSQDGHEMGRMV